MPTSRAPRRSSRGGSSGRATGPRPSPSPAAPAQPSQAQPAQARRVTPTPSAVRPTDLEVSRTTAWVGAISAFLTAIWTVWFTPTFALWMTRLPAWTGIEAYAASFEAGPFLAWLIPCLLLPPTFVALLAVIDLGALPARRVWSRLGLVFALVYAAVLTTNYWLQYAVVMPALLAGELEGLSWLVIGNPRSVAGALEGLGYGAMGLAALFAGLAFGGRDGDRSRSSRAIRWLLVVNGAGGFAGYLAGTLGYINLTFVALAIWCVTLPIALVILGLRYVRVARGDARA